jgi:signal transduction histidine kinase
MRRLYFSIVVAVIGSLFLISWGLDSLVENHVEHEDSSDTVLYKQLLEGLSKELNDTPPHLIKNKVTDFEQYYSISASLKPSNDVALPQSILFQLSNPGGLLLASESNPYLLKRVEKHPEYLLQIQLPSETAEAQPFDIILTTILYVGVCSIIILWLLPLTRRLYLLTSVAEKIGEGDLSRRVPTSKFSYIRAFESSFNQMASQIEKLVTDNKILARSLSHDIRTPMSCLRFGVEAALDTDDLNKKNTYINRMESELTRMEDMTSVFLEYAGLERQGFNLKKEDISINDFLVNITNDLQSLAEQYNVTLMFHSLSKDVTANIDEYWCQRAIQNLVGNAVQYAKSQVHISIKEKTTTIEIIVSDDGIGLPENKLDAIFGPFVKLDTNRSRENGHFGLGLAICNKIMDWHQGRIFAKNSVHYGGASFTLSFPLKK